MLDRVLGWWSLLARFSRVECYFLSGCLLGVLFAFGYDMGAGYALEERVYRGAGRSRRRARGDGVVWSGVALPCLCGGSCPGLFFREGEGATASFRPLRLCVRKVVFVDEHTNMVVTTTTT